MDGCLNAEGMDEKGCWDLGLEELHEGGVHGAEHGPELRQRELQ